MQGQLENGYWVTIENTANLDTTYIDHKLDMLQSYELYEHIKPQMGNQIKIIKSFLLMSPISP
jgi:hypothetical protein